MPRYFFHVRKDGREPDTTGVELPGLEEARVEAAECLAQELHDHRRELWNDEDWSIEVTDDRGLVLLIVQSAAFEAASVKKPDA